MTIIREDYESIKELCNTLSTRPNNKVMKARFESNNKDYFFSQTKSYEEAENMLRYGYLKPLEELKTSIKKIDYSFSNWSTSRFKVHNDVVGYIPNVPNHILALPDSMINFSRIPKKVPTIDVYYFNTGNCHIESKEFILSGIEMVKALYLIEKKGIRTRLNVVFQCAKVADEFLIGTLMIKDYSHKFDLRRVCFPLMHPSMLRRIGFKFTETVPGIVKSWDYGYGESLKIEEILETRNELGFNKGVLISRDKIKNLNYSTDKIIDYIITNGEH